MNKKNIFIACDTTNIKKLKNIIQNTQSNQINVGYKFGLELFNSKNGRKFISKLKNKKIWLDLKLYDIPNTVFSSIHSLKDLKNISYLTVHISGGLKMLKFAKKAAKQINSKLKIIGVTILTSFSNKSIKEIGFSNSIEKIVKKQINIAKKARLNGVVCSGYEAKIIKKKFKGEIITPGIRFAMDKSHDQKRVMSPSKAFANGATSIVIGRSITAGNIKKNFKKLIISLK
ncbi:MAG: orotidine-5'-phosphate decarboxylase [Pelagibacteraceae bacterium]